MINLMLTSLMMELYFFILACSKKLKLWFAKISWTSATWKDYRIITQLKFSCFSKR